jgi:aryl-alcohol dehydrogenase-like predicted oxidoreductase
LLTGKYRRGEPRPEGTRLAGRDNVFTDEAFDRLEALEAFAKERGLTLLQVAIGGLLARPVVASVIAGATKPEQVRANVEASEWETTPDDVASLDALR